jgi:predicted esterase
MTMGAAAEQATLAIIMLHGRGASAAGLKPLAETLMVPGCRFLLPQAAREYWYPQSAFAAIESNQPDLDSALALLDRLVDELHQSGFKDEQIAFGGFSQGACLAAEFVVRNARPYAGLFLFSGALIGPEGTSHDFGGTLEGMPAFIGSSDTDPWVAQQFLEKTAEVLAKLGAEVDFRTYPGMGHTVNQDEIEAVRQMLSSRLNAV